MEACIKARGKTNGWTLTNYRQLAAMAAFCHDMGNFLTRAYHHFFGAQLFGQVFMGKIAPDELAMIMQAISNHDKDEMNFVELNPNIMPIHLFRIN